MNIKEDTRPIIHNIDMLNAVYKNDQHRIVEVPLAKKLQYPVIGVVMQLLQDELGCSSEFVRTIISLRFIIVNSDV